MKRNIQIIKEGNKRKNMSKKNTIRLTESELKSLIKESVKNVLNESGFGNLLNRITKGGQVSNTYNQYLNTWQNSYLPALKQLDAAVKQQYPDTKSNYVNSYSNAVNLCLQSLQKGDLNVTQTLDRHFAKIAKQCQDWGIQIPKARPAQPQAQPAQQQGQQPTQRQANAGQMQGQAQQQAPQENVKALTQGALEYAKEIKLWQAGRGGYNAYNQLLSNCQRICAVTGENPEQKAKDFLAQVYV